MARATLRGIELAWTERGQGDLILFLHGFPFNRTSWEPQLAALPPGWRGVAPDLRGFGQSGGSDERAYTMEDHAADMLALLDHLGATRAVVCGLSMGGYVALAMERRTPERVRALVLADTRAEPDSEEARAQRMDQAQRIEQAGPGEFLDGMLPKLLAPAAADRVRGAVGSMMAGTSPQTLVRALHGLAARVDARPALASIRAPTLVIGGAEDAITPPATLRALAEGIPGARLELLDGAGHVANLEAERAFNGALHRFLAGLPAG